MTEMVCSKFSTRKQSIKMQRGEKTQEKEPRKAAHRQERRKRMEKHKRGKILKEKLRTVCSHKKESY